MNQIVMTAKALKKWMKQWDYWNKTYFTEELMVTADITAPYYVFHGKLYDNITQKELKSLP